jgi:hypothetical protein
MLNKVIICPIARLEASVGAISVRRSGSLIH